MELAIVTVVNALMLSAVYILAALGFAFVLNVIGIVNVAHGAVYMVGAYICYQFAVEWGMNQWLALLISVIIVASFGLFLEKFCFRPFANNFYSTVIVSIAIILILETAVNVTMGFYVRSLPAFVPGIITTAAFSLSAQRLVTFIICGVLLLILIWFIGKTKAGQQMLAVSQSAEGAALQGISINRVSAIVWVLACGMAALAGALMGSMFSLSPFMGDDMLVKAFEIVILGGIGSISGIFFAGLIVGTLDATLPLFLSGAASQSIAMALIIAILLFRPRGLLGRDL